MNVTLLGMGSGSAAQMTQAAEKALSQPAALSGQSGCWRSCPKAAHPTALPPPNPGIFWQFCKKTGNRTVRWFTAATADLFRLPQPAALAEGWQVTVLPGISSVQLLAAALGRPWQDWLLVSAHGVDCNAVAAVMQGRPAFFLTGGTLGPASLCAQLTKAGWEIYPLRWGRIWAHPNRKSLPPRRLPVRKKSFSPQTDLENSVR